MFEPKLTDPHPESAKTYPQKVHCSQLNRDAEIIVANWPLSEEGWSGWCTHGETEGAFTCALGASIMPWNPAYDL